MAEGDLPLEVIWKKNGVPILINPGVQGNNVQVRGDKKYTHLKNLINMKIKFSIYTILIKWVTFLGFLHLKMKVRRIDEYTSLLAISYLETEHAGNYSCVATNSVAEYVRSAVLTIRGKFFQYCEWIQRLPEKIMESIFRPKYQRPNKYNDLNIFIPKKYNIKFNESLNELDYNFYFAKLKEF